MRNRLSIFNFNNRDPLAAIVLFIAMVVAIETTLSFLPQNLLVQLFQANRRTTDSPAQLQIMGDSVAQGGIIAESLTQALPPGNTVFNHAVAGSGPEFSYFILKRDIEAGHAPKTIIYAPSPHTFGSLRIPLMVGAFCDWREIFEVAASGKKPFEALYGVLCKISYTLRYREQISEMLKGRKPTSGIVEATIEPAISSSQLKPVTRFPKEKLHAMYQKKFSVQDFNSAFLEKFLALAKQHNIRVFWVTMPVLPVVYESREQFAFDADYFAFLEDLQRRHGIEYLQKEFLLFDEAEFKDSTHLNKTGAERFTQILGAKLSASEPPISTSMSKR